MTTVEMDEYLFRKGFIKLLEIKDSDIRIVTLQQCRDAVDKGIHIGGAFSAVVPLVSLFYGGVMQSDIADPTKLGQDMFVLSKGHAVAPMASIYADIGYFDKSGNIGAIDIIHIISLATVLNTLLMDGRHNSPEAFINLVAWPRQPQAVL